MKNIILLLSSFLLINIAFGQTKGATIVSEKEVKQIFTATVKQKFGITFNISRVYRYTDKTGTFLVAFTENIANITAEKDTLIDKIKGYCFKESNNLLEKQWEINDFIQANGINLETSIHFWNRYLDFQDIDKDNVVEPILVYGIKSMNDYEGGRIKILIFYKGKKVAIRHQNGVLDDQRSTQIDIDFYDLPQSLQSHVKEIMNKIASNKHAIFPNNLEAEMKKRKTKIAE
jgi:hypothetical protein